MSSSSRVVFGNALNPTLPATTTSPRAGAIAAQISVPRTSRVVSVTLVVEGTDP